MDFTSKDPVVIGGYIRWWLADISTTELPDDTLQYIIDIVISNNPSGSGCDLIYLATLDVLKYLIRKQARGQVGSGGSGSSILKKQTEKVGEVTVTQEWGVDEGTASVASGWDRVLQDLLDSPNSIGCAITQSETQTASTGSLVIGGSSLAEAERVRTNTDSRSGFCISNPFRNKSGW